MMSLEEDERHRYVEIFQSHVFKGADMKQQPIKNITEELKLL